MEREEKKRYAANVLADRGMSVTVCPLGTGLVLTQRKADCEEFTAHLTSSEARELVSALVVAVHNARQSMVGTKSVNSLYVQGLRIDQIATELNMTSKEVREALISRGLLKDSGLA